MFKSNRGRAALVVGALGVVFGDIGTSPLYAINAVFHSERLHLAITPENVYGIISLIVWSVLLVVSLKYISLVMRVDNQGEGGIMALVSIVKSSLTDTRAKWFFVTLGLIGMTLFYGDSVVTPAISVLAAVEGVKTAAPGLAGYIIPITLVILTLLFGVQKFGTNVVGRLFGPVMVVWFVTIGLGGGWQIWQHPEALRILSPLTALEFFVYHAGVAFVAMTAVVLAITGAEALYADMGHFGRPAITRAWFWLVFPALILCYTGQGALLLAHPDTATLPLFYLFPSGLRLAIVGLATLATLIASQSVISGAFSITRQAMHLGFLPRMQVRHTSNSEVGQIYMPFVNYILFLLVVLLVLLFGSSQKLAGAYGVAVSGTLAIDTILFLAVIRSLWQRSWAAVVLIGCVLLPLDTLFVSANVSKVVHGGWIPLLLASVVFVLVTTWIKGQKIVVRERHQQAGTLKHLVKEIHDSKELKRFAGEAVYIGHHPNYAPLALRANLEELHELPQKVLIISISITNEAHVPEAERTTFDALGYADGISHLQLRYGFHDSINIPKMLQSLRGLSSELDFDPRRASYYISLYKVVPTHRHNLAGWRKALYGFMLRNSLSHTDYYKLPLHRTQEISSLIRL